ncbi:ATP-dependent DNA ligase [Cryobacterium arcticum]|uniref:ATP-dependent DNA ligase n=1 Tax=Cryobacterium arcticum TaxID=670052 RepID=A0A317ZNH2_9MICO|nr:ATP-dependent DNA ligase [Cryobacterium arcticum]PXA67996.1 ATP-dependent DNA ligase [Cryobacterium arcticum]
MGKLIYDGINIEFDDRTLVHLQVVIGLKLRRAESFFLSWNDSPALGGGRSSVWLQASMPLYFKYYGGTIPSLNRAWIDTLTVSANSGQGLLLTTEPNSPDQRGKS